MNKLMRRQRRGYGVLLGLLVAFLVVAHTHTALATESTSPNYLVTETEFGSGTELDTCSGEYCARATIGDISGQGSSPSYTATFGTITADSEPSLDVIIEPGQSNLGVLSTTRTASKTMAVHIRSHLAGGYMLQIVGDSPSYGDHTLATPTTATTSIQGAEQFAINAVANDLPGLGALGADPVFTPSDEVDDTAVTAQYRSPNLFAYTSGDIVALTSSESSQIRYTISMIINVSAGTPAGHFTGDYSAVVTPVF